MKKIDVKSFVLGVLVTIMISTGVIAIANGVNQTIDVVLNGIGIYIHKDIYPGNTDNALPSGLVQSDTKTILFNDTTYVPLRLFAEAFGIPVNYVESTNSVILGAWYDGKDQYYVPNETPISAPTPTPNVITPKVDEKRTLKYLIDNPDYADNLTGLNIHADNENFVGVITPKVWFTNKANYQINAVSMVLNKNGKELFVTETYGNDWNMIDVDGNSVKQNITGINTLDELLADDVIIKNIAYYFWQDGNPVLYVCDFERRLHCVQYEGQSPIEISFDQVNKERGIDS